MPTRATTQTTNLTIATRFPGLGVVLAVVALAGGCQGIPPQPSSSDPAVVLLTPAAPTTPTTPGDPSLPDVGAIAAAPLQPYQVPTAPWEVVLRYPPEVEATVLARWEEHHRDHGGGQTVVYLNFEGQAITYSNYDSNATTNTSWIPGKNVTIPAFNASHWGSNRQTVITSIVADLQQTYAGYNITFTTTRPTSGNYMMTMIGGSAALIGQQQGVLGVSPLDCQPGENLNLNPLDVNFICSEDIAAYGMNLWSLVYTIAHENAHTYGLAHINRQGDIMYWAEDGTTTLSWGAASTRSGESNCSTNNYQDDKAYLTKAIGGAGTNPETTPPTVAITSPANGATVQSGLTVTVTAADASGVKQVDLYVNGAINNSMQVAPYQFTLLGLLAGTYQLQAKASDIYDNIGSSAVVTVTVPGPQPTGCQTDAQCAANQKCQNGSCVNLPPTPVGGALGADCQNNADCQSGWCILGSQNYCTQACNPAQNVYCPVGYDCSADGFCLSSTPIPPGAVGAPCNQNAQCRTNICASGENNGYCTSVCQQGGTPCPDQAQCIDSGDGQTFVCDRPPTGDGGTNLDHGASGGCSASGASGTAIFAPLALFVLFGARRRRRPTAAKDEEVHGGY